MTTKQPFMPLYVKDYDDDTRHLTAEEDGVYGRLLRAMWTAGGQLPRDERRLAQIARIDIRRWRVLAPTIMAFFSVAGQFIEQKRIKAELRRVADLSTTRSEAGKKGGRPRSNGHHPPDADKNVSRREVQENEKPNENWGTENQMLSGLARAPVTPARDLRVQSSDSENPNGFSLEPTDEPPAFAIPKKRTVRQVLETVLSPPIARALIEHRVSLRKPLTTLGAERLVPKLAEAPTIAGVTADEAAAQMIDRGWRGFDAEWLLNAQTARHHHESTGPPAARQSREDSERAAWNKVLDDAAKGKHHG